MSNNESTAIEPAREVRHRRLDEPKVLSPRLPAYSHPTFRPLVLGFQPLEERLEIGDQWPGGQAFTGGLAKDGVPVRVAPQAENTPEEITNLGVAI